LAAETALKWDIDVPSDQIKVTVENAFVTLGGEVNWRSQRSATSVTKERNDYERQT